MTCETTLDLSYPMRRDSNRDVIVGWSAFVLFFRQVRARPANWNRSKLSFNEIPQRVAVMQVKPDRRPSGRRVSAVLCRRDTERREEFLITLQVDVVYGAFKGPQHQLQTICSRAGF